MHQVVILKDSAYEHLLQNAINLFWYSSYMDGIEWFKNAIIYHIFIDRFAGFKETKDWEKTDFLGGNIKGIIQKIQYIKDFKTYYSVIEHINIDIFCYSKYLFG